MNPLEPLIKALSRLPGIGEKSATRLSLFILRDTKGLTQELIRALTHLKEKVHFCRQCQNLTEQEICDLCQDPERNPRLICVVEEPVDVLALEKTGEFSGQYHVLQGSLAPLSGQGPEDLRISSLLQRVQDQNVEEVILAMNPNAEGETTALYLKKILVPMGIKVSRLASGVPVGGILEYTDAKTLSRALQNRNSF